MAWLAQLQNEDQNPSARDAPRRQLRLHVAAIAGPTTSRVLVHNISTTGLLVECDEHTALPDTFEVELPEQGMTAARVVWRSDNFYGCEFDSPVASRVVSAAQLRSPPEKRPELTLPSILPSQPFDFENDQSELRAKTDGLSARRRMAIIVGAAASLWGVILMGAFLLA